MVPRILDKAARIKAGDGEVILAAALQGRIFAALDDELLHRLDVPLAEHPSDSFNNLGGNSLWPAPEGGDFAFNYPSDGGPWRVQDGINSVPSHMLPDGRGMIREITLENRKGVSASLLHSRIISVPEYGFGRKYGVKELVYCSCDSLELTRPLPASEFLMSAWSLEQFDLTDGAFGFGTAKPVEKAVNTDFYGDPGSKIVRAGETFAFRFGGPDRLQIGISEKAEPGVIGAYIPEKDLAVVRRIVRADAGTRINFADNEQKDGVYSADDKYSIFYGPDARFFEVESLAPVRIVNGLTTGSSMETETHFYRGAAEKIKELLHQEFNINKEIWS